MMIQGVREIDLELGRECLTLESEKLRVERTKKRACSSILGSSFDFPILDPTPSGL